MERNIIQVRKMKHFADKNLLKGIALIVGIFCLHILPQAQMKQNAMSQHTNTADSLKSYMIHQEVDFKESPEQIYKALLDSKQFSELTGKTGGFSATSAKIDPAAGGTFSVFDGHITGRILELVPNKRIVQAWRVMDWPEGIYSIAKFELNPQGSGTHLVFDHTGFPVDLKEHLAIGWQLHYWEAMKGYFKK